jgi:uncharacterized protein YggU (UPF0235/DUF167 family)
MARVRIWVKPGSVVDRLGWDPWRDCWIVACRAPALAGKANQAVVELMAGWLGEPVAAIRWSKAGTSRAKVLEIDGLNDAEVEHRLRPRVGRRSPGTGAASP